MKLVSHYFRILVFFEAFMLASCYPEPVKVGVYHSLSGTLAISGRSMVDATLLAIDEINAEGGILGGRKIKPVVLDNESSVETYGKKAEEFIKSENVRAIFGCWSSDCRRQVRHVVEKYNIFLMYPVQYEGFESSKNILYTGGTPSQQIIPAVKWFLENKGKRIYLVGSDYIFPRTANLIIRDLADIQGGIICGEKYAPMGAADFSSIARDILLQKPDIIFNTINGDSNAAFFRDLHIAGIKAEEFPVVSFSIAEDELRQMNISEMAGHFAVWNYFQSVDNPENRIFVDNFRRKFGKDRVTDDPMESAYISVKLWAKAVNEAGYLETNRIRETFKRQSINSPAGIVTVDYENLHLWKRVYIGRINSAGQFDILWTSDGHIRPVVYPTYRLKNDWELIMDKWR